MNYTTVNFLTSLTESFATHARASGHDIFWYEDKTTSARTNVGAAKATITIVAAYPTEPRFVSRLSSDSAGFDDIVLPAVSLYAPHGPMRVELLGLGHRDSEWTRNLIVEAFASTKQEQMEILDLMHTWLLEEPTKALPMQDYSVPSSPVSLDPLYVEDAGIFQIMAPTGFDALQYMIRVDADLFYFE